MWNNILDEQFELSYHANISFTDTEEMAIFERRDMYDRLIHKMEEKAKAVKEHQQKVASTRPAKRR